MTLLQGERNPFLHHPVVQCLFEYLAFQDIKNCRFVCATWNFVSEPLLRKRGKVVFLDSFRPASFIEYCESHLPTVPFTSFKFTNFNQPSNCNSNWAVTEIPSFLATYGTKIKCIEFDNLTAFRNETDGGLIEALGSHFHEYIDLAPNLVDIKIGGSSSTSFVVTLYKFVSVKKIYLENCTVDLISNKDRITPLKICLQKTKFQINGVDVNRFSLHDFIDFNRCTEIECHPSSAETKLTFDMSSIVTANKVDIHCFQFLNWSTSRANIDHLLVMALCGPTDDIKMKIKKLTLRYARSLYFLPRTIEELTLERGVTLCFPPINLPNLKCLKLCPQNFYLDEFSGLSFFKSCSKLSDLILQASTNIASYIGNDYQHPLNVNWIPVSVKRIKLTTLQNFSFVFDAVIDVDILELDVGKISDAQNVINYVRPKVLVCSAIQKIHCDDFIEFVQKNKQIFKIYLGFRNHDNIASVINDDSEFRKSIFSVHVDKEACIYEFENGRGKAISDEQFQSVTKW